MEHHIPPGPPVRLRPGKTPFLLVTAGLTTQFIVVLHYTLIPWLSAGYTQLWDAWIYFHMFVLFKKEQ